MITERTKLKTGEELVIKILHPPLADYASKVRCWGDIRSELLGGKMREWQAERIANTMCEECNNGEFVESKGKSS